MKSQRRNLLAAGLIAVAGFGVAIAQTPATSPAGGPGRDPARVEQFRAKMQERMAKRMGELKQKLAITPAQEGAWSAWTESLKPTPHQRPDRAEIAKLTTPERIDRMRALRAERNANMDKRMDATKTFYGALNAEQKKVFDAESMRFLAGGKRHGRHGHGGEHRHHGAPRS